MERLVEYLQRRGFTLMLAMLVGYLLLASYAQSVSKDVGDLPATVLLGCTLLGGIYASGVGRRGRAAAIVVTLLAVVLAALSAADEKDAAGRASDTLLILLGLVTLVVGFMHVNRTTEVDSDKIAGLTCVYILLGIIWSVAYMRIAQEFGPEAFGLDPSMSKQELNAELYYYSWVTLTTLGYGDITPKQPLVRVLANIECVIGQLYIAIVVARLVAIQVAKHLKG